MTMIDRIALARAGYKKKEIEEMLADEASIDNEELAPTKSALSLGNGSKEEQEANQEEEEEKITEISENSENVSDKIQEELLAAFEEQKEEIANLQKQLKEAQTANTRVNMNVESVEDKEQEIIKKLMEG